MEKLCNTDNLLKILNKIIESLGYGEIISLKLRDGESSQHTITFDK